MQAQWTQTSGPAGGSVTCFAISDNYIYAGVYIGGVYVSTDNGSSWRHINNGLPLSSGVSAIAINGNNIFAGVNDPTSYSFGFGAFLSTDGGLSWSPALNGMGNQYINAFTFNGNNVFAGTNEGVYISTDNGSNWSLSNKGIPETEVLSLAVKGGIVFAGTIGGDSYLPGAGGIYLSSDNGANWRLANNNLQFKSLTRENLKPNFGYSDPDSLFHYKASKLLQKTAFPLVLHPSVFSFLVDGNNIFAGTTQGVYISTDNGNLWTLKTDGLIYGENVYAFAVSGNKIYAGTSNGGIYQTTNNGDLWTETNKGLPPIQVSALIFSKNNLLAGTHGIYASSDMGSNWYESDYGLAGQTVYNIAMKDDVLFAGTPGGLYRSTDNGINWKHSDNGIYGNVAEFVISGNNIFTGGAGVNLSTNNGVSWTPIGMNDAVIFALAVKGNNIFVGTLYGVYRSTDLGKSWSLLINGMNPLVNYFAITYCGNNIFAAGSDPSTGINYDYVSTDNGSSWTPVNVNISTNDFVISAASIGDTILAGTYAAGMFISTDKGYSWGRINKGISNLVVRSVVIHNKNIYIGTDAYYGKGGVYVTSNYGLDWFQFNDGLTTLEVGTTIFHNDEAFVATEGNGVWRREIKNYVLVELISFTAYLGRGIITLNWEAAAVLDNMVFDVERSIDKSNWGKLGFVKGDENSGDYSYVDKTVTGSGKYYYRLKQIDNKGAYKYSQIVEVNINTPSVFSLSQNYPNPFNPSTIISYFLTAGSNVNLIVYNTIGQTVKILENNFKDAGSYSVNFNAADLPSGIYFYRIKAGSFVETKKMMLLR